MRPHPDRPNLLDVSLHNGGAIQEISGHSASLTDDGFRERLALGRYRQELLRPSRNPPRRLDLAQQARLEETALQLLVGPFRLGEGRLARGRRQPAVQFPPQLPHLLTRQRTDAAEEVIEFPLCHVSHPP